MTDNDKEYVGKSEIYMHNSYKCLPFFVQSFEEKQAKIQEWCSWLQLLKV